MGKTATPILYDKLYTLDTVLDKEKMRDVFVRLADAHWDRNREVYDLQIEVMRRRNQRCVIRYIVNIYDRREEKNVEWRIVGKVYKANRGEGVFDTMKTLWQNGFTREKMDGISMPEPIAFSSSLCLLFQEEVPGVPIKNLLREEYASANYMRLLARTLAKLHLTPIQPGSAYTIDDHLLRCHPRYPFLCLACPELEPKIEYIIRRAKEYEARNGKIQLSPVHGDFHLGQVHIDGDRSWLIDFDALCYADPAADVGNLMVFLKGKARRHPQWQAYIDAFLDEYYAIMGSDVALRVPLYEALTHVRRACKCLRYQEKSWSRKVEKMIDQGIACIDSVVGSFTNGTYSTNGKLEHVGIEW
ncbi:MAG: phosphotransferase family protein [bacterium]